MQTSVILGDSVLTLEAVAAIADGASVSLGKAARKRVIKSRELVVRKAASEVPTYGVNTGFGALAEVKIEPDQIAELQRNLILSHAAGVGKPLARRETRAMMVLRAQTVASGFSGVRPEVIEQLLDMLNAGVHPIVPEKGSVGASGDLSPLAHLVLGMIGEGWVEYQGEVIEARQALTRVGMKPLALEAKEGLALVNGTQAMAALGTLVQLEAEHLCRVADITGALTLEGLAGIPAAFDARIQAARPHPGQIEVASHLRRLLANSSTHLPRPESLQPRVQDPYSLRCMPQVHGATRDVLAFTRQVLEREINSATDNPLVFADEGDILSGGNFHGQPLALAFDFAAIALAELGNISERRVEQMLNPALSGLPPFLIATSGIHSGYMLAQITAAALVNENKVFCTPASIDSIPGSACREDHVSMGMTSARKLREVVINLRSILAIEMLCAAQAVDLRNPQRLGNGTAVAHHVIRQRVPTLEVDRYLSPDIEALTELAQEPRFVTLVEDALV